MQAKKAIILLFLVNFVVSGEPIKASTESVLQDQPMCPQRNATLYFINNDSDLILLRIEEDPQPPKLFLKESSMDTDVIMSLAFNHNSGEMLFTSQRGPNKIQAVDRESNVRLFASYNTRFDHVAIDPVTKNIYYAGNGIGIGVCDKDVNICVTLVEAESSEVRYKELILNPKLGQMLWIQENLAPVLKIASMDGKKVRVLSAFEHVHAISLDADNEILYIAEEDSIIQLNLKEFTRIDFAPIRTSALIYFNCDLYYVQRSHQTLQIYTGEGETKEIAALNGDSFPFAVVSDDFKHRQPNPCQFLKCKGVCVLAEGSLTPVTECICKSCHVEKVVESSGLSAVWIVFLIFLCISIGSFAFFLFVHYRIWPALSDKIEELCGVSNENVSNISVGFNNSALE
jgi:hypothetical protein